MRENEHGNPPYDVTDEQYRGIQRAMGTVILTMVDLRVVEGC
jgi:hypothetical protein